MEFSIRHHKLDFINEAIQTHEAPVETCGRQLDRVT